MAQAARRKNRAAAPPAASSNHCRPVQQRIEAGSSSSVERHRQPFAMAAPAAHRRRDGADLGGDRSTAAANGRPRRAAARARGRRTSLPRRCVPRRRRGPAPDAGRLRSAEAWTISSCSSGAASGKAKRAAEPPAPAALAAGSMSTTVSTHGWDARQQATPHSSPTTPAPMTSTRSPASGAASHSTFSAVSMLAASTARGVGTASGTGMHIAAGARKRSWCGCSTKTRRPSAPRPHRAVAVFTGKGNRRPSAAPASPGIGSPARARRTPARSVPREMPLASVRTRACPAARRRQCLGADFARPGATVQNAVAFTRTPPAARGRARCRTACRAQRMHRPGEAQPFGERAASGRVKAGMPEPISTGATVTCSRSRQPAARKRLTVTPPPSTKMRRSPRAASAARIAATSSPPPRARQPQHSAPCPRAHRRAHPRRRAAGSGGPRGRRGRELSRRSVSSTTRTGEGPSDVARGQPRVVAAPCRRRPQLHRTGRAVGGGVNDVVLSTDPMGCAAGRRDPAIERRSARSGRVQSNSRARAIGVASKATVERRKAASARRSTNRRRQVSGANAVMHWHITQMAMPVVQAREEARRQPVGSCGPGRRALNTPSAPLPAWRLGDTPITGSARRWPVPAASGP